jgi:pimeloyl-ACP methyl ester carboxylesterase
MALWKKILGGVALAALVAGGTYYWRTTNSGAPLDYNNPTGKTIEVGFIRYPAIGFGSTPTLQMIGGGPGSAITDEVKEGLSPQLRLALHNRSLLFIDPRGVGLSTRLDCSAFRNLKGHSEEPSLKQLCIDQLGPDVEHYTTENTARDFERVRQALGIAELDLYGFSYGTHLGSVYTSLFPKHIRTLGLDGALPATTFTPFHPENYVTMKRQIQQICERSGECMAEDVLEALAWATDELRKAPRPLDALVKKDRAYKQPLQLDVATLAAMAASDPQPSEDEKTGSLIWRQPFISALLKAYKQKDWADLDALAAIRLSLPKKQLEDPMFLGELALFNVIACRDWTVAWKRTSTIEQRHLEYKASAAAYDKENPNAFAPFTAAEWGMRRGGNGIWESFINCPVQKTPLSSLSERTFTWPDSLPVLVVNGDYDFQTVNEDAEIVVAQFKSAQFARFKHHGHSILPSSMCAVQLLREFLDNKRVADPMKCYEADAAPVSIKKGKEEARMREAG